MRTAYVFGLTFAFARVFTRGAFNDRDELVNFFLDPLPDEDSRISNSDSFLTDSAHVMEGSGGNFLDVTYENQMDQNPFSTSSNDLGTEDGREFLFTTNDGLIGLGDICSSDAESLDFITKRDTAKTCSPTRGGFGNRKPEFDPDDFLNKIPIFSPQESAKYYEDKEICRPVIVGDRPFPVCHDGDSEFIENGLGSLSELDLFNCSPHEKGIGCARGDKIYCCAVASVDELQPFRVGEVSGLVAQSDDVFNDDRCAAWDCVYLYTQENLAPFLQPLSAIVSSTSSPTPTATPS